MKIVKQVYSNESLETAHLVLRLTRQISPRFSVPTKIKDYIKVLIREMWNKIGDNLLFTYL